MTICEVLCGAGHQGLSNILLNIILLLIYNLETKNEQKIIVYFKEKRHDYFLNFCDKIINNKLEIKNYKEYNKDRDLLTLKSKRYKIQPELEIIMQRKSNEDLFTDFKFGYTYVTKNILKKSLKYFQFKLNNLIQKKVNYIQEKMGKYISVHIRTTDFPLYKKHVNENNIEEYFTTYYDFIDKFKDYNIYLSTDSKKVHDIFKKKYQDKIFWCENISSTVVYKNRYVSGESIYIDYICCRDSDYFCPTQNSTFSDFIKLLRFIKKENL